jgi:tetrahydromethanopterin S-methyltransferase subunit G
VNFDLGHAAAYGADKDNEIEELREYLEAKDEKIEEQVMEISELTHKNHGRKYCIAFVVVDGSSLF